MQSSRDDGRPPLPYLKQICDDFSPVRENLNPVTVYYVNRNLPMQFSFRLHGYIIINSHPPAICLQKTKLSANDEYVYAETMHAHAYTMDGVNVDGIARVFPLRPSSDFSKKDSDAFEKGDVTFQSYPSINPTCIYELFQQQRIFWRYLDEKLGDLCEAERIKKRLVKFVPFPAASRLVEDVKNAPTHFLQKLMSSLQPDDAPFFTNCNTATATILQEAEYLSVKNDFAESKRPSADIVTGASAVAIGSTSRMFFWGSRLQQLVVGLFINREFKEDDPSVAHQVAVLEQNPELLKELVHKTNYILQVIDTWPLPQQKMALEQILNDKTPLGKVFAKQAVVTFGVMEYLGSALVMLQNVTENLMEKAKLVP